MGIGAIGDDMSVVHELKTWPEPFAAIVDGRKTFEYRKSDRAFEVGDLLELREYDPETEDYTGAWVLARITYIMPGGQFGIPEGYCVMSFGEPR